MLKYEFNKLRKEAIDYQVSINARLKEIADPLKHLQIEWFGYGKFFLDSQQHCDKFFWVNTHLESFNWYCLNAFDNGFDFTEAIQQTKLNEFNYFLTPVKTDDYIVKTFRELFGLYAGLSIYKRHGQYVELWDFSTTQTNSILSTTILATKTIELLSKYINFFNTKISNLDFCEQAAIKFPSKINLSLNSASKANIPSFLKAIQSTPFSEQLQGKSFTFSKREWECLHMLTEGKTMKGIAKTLNLSPRTVESYLNKIKHKSGYHFKSDLIKLYREYSAN